MGAHGMAAACCAGALAHGGGRTGAPGGTGEGVGVGVRRRTGRAHAVNAKRSTVASLRQRRKLYNAMQDEPLFACRYQVAPSAYTLSNIVYGGRLGRRGARATRQAVPLQAVPQSSSEVRQRVRCITPLLRHLSASNQCSQLKSLHISTDISELTLQQIGSGCRSVRIARHCHTVGVVSVPQFRAIKFWHRRSQSNWGTQVGAKHGGPAHGGADRRVQGGL